MGYSKDDKSVFYFNKKIKNADVDSFELYGVESEIELYGEGGKVEELKKYITYYGKDKNNYYDGCDIVSLNDIIRKMQK